MGSLMRTLSTLLLALVLLSNSAPILAAAEAPQLMGGYSTIDINDPAVQTAAEFAAQQLKVTLTKVIAAKSQVVAGMNYDLTLELKDSDGTDHVYNVIVFVPLPVAQKPMQLIRWNAIEK